MMTPNEGGECDIFRWVDLSWIVDQKTVTNSRLLGLLGTNPLLIDLMIRLYGIQFRFLQVEWFLLSQGLSWTTLGVVVTLELNMTSINVTLSFLY